MTKTPNIPPIIESDEREYRDSGIPSKAAIAGHPLHPAAVTLPIAFLVAAPFTDIGYWLTRDLFWARASVWLIGAGLVTGIVAALLGMVDFFSIDRAQKHTTGWIHMFANGVALVLSAINLGLRWNDPVNSILFTGLIVSAIVATLIGISGWFGGELVYRHKIGVVGEGEAEQT
jgi:uncharacterized membrane protein